MEFASNHTLAEVAVKIALKKVAETHSKLLALKKVFQMNSLSAPDTINLLTEVYIELDGQLSKDSKQLVQALHVRNDLRKEKL